jgi:uncharacterized protein (TIGR00369 family)
MSNCKIDQIKKLADKCGYYNLLGMEIAELEYGYARFRFKDQPQLRNLAGTAVHGGAICSILDAATAISLDTILPQDTFASTVNIQVDFLSSFNGCQEVFAEGKIIKNGNRIAVGEARLVDSEGTIIAKALATLIKNNKAG